MIVYVAGMGRSGSTLLGRLLGDATGGFFASEVAALPRAIAEGRRCTCGKAADECSFWSPIGADTDLDALRRWFQSVMPPHRVALRLSRRARRRAATTLSPERLLSDLYLRIQRAAGTPLIVDTSKRPTWLDGLLRSGLDVRVVHLWRDPRAVAWSYARHRDDGSGALMPRARSGVTAGKWSLENLGVRSVVREHRPPTVECTYDDLVTDPSGLLGHLVHRLGLPGGSEENGDHALSGNASRFDDTTIRNDREWETAMPAHQRALVTALTRWVRRPVGATL